MGVKEGFFVGMCVLLCVCKYVFCIVLWFFKRFVSCVNVDECNYDFLWVLSFNESVGMVGCEFSLLNKICLFFVKMCID